MIAEAASKSEPISRDRLERLVGVSALQSDLIDLGTRAPTHHPTFKNSGFAIDHNSARPPILLDHRTGSSLNNSSTCDVLSSTTW
jgi:hypothetical protein